MNFRIYLSYSVIIVFSILILSCSDDGDGGMTDGTDWDIDTTKEEWEQQTIPGCPELWHTGLPVVVITTPDSVEIDSKYSWVENSDIQCFLPDSALYVQTSMRIRLHGNSSMMNPKKSYNLDLDTKEKMFSMPSHRRWILIANHFDKTMLRNEIGLWFGRKFCDFEYTPRGLFVEVILNGEHLGTYYLCEHIRQSSNRVKDGYVLEIDDKHASDDVIYTTGIKNLPVNMKDPDVIPNSSEYYMIGRIVDSVERVLYGDSPFDSENGYFRIADRSSFADFYIVNEIAKNVDARFYTSCYMNLKSDSRLFMGPLWDFDVGFGNYVFENPYTINEPTGLYMHRCPWIEIMLKEPVFRDIVSSHLSRYISGRDHIMQHIDEIAESMLSSVILNERKWNVLSDNSTDMSDTEIKELYLEEVEKLKMWIDDRLNYLDSKY